MTAQLIDGNALAATVRAEVAHRVQALQARGVQPHLSIILVGDNPASQVYVRNKVADSQQTGLSATLERYPAELPQAELLARIAALNADPAVHGILVQLPLPPHMDAHAVIEAIAPATDVDGFHVASAGALMVGQPGFRPCTPYGCMRMLQSIGLHDLRGRHAVVIGRSNIVGKPMAMLLLTQNATVTVCHSGTSDLAALTRQADIVVAAVGRAHMITADMIKPGAVCIDVGVTRVNGKPVGDLAPDVWDVASLVTPNPGGVGPMTRAMLLANVVDLAEGIV